MAEITTDPKKPHPLKLFILPLLLLLISSLNASELNESSFLSSPEFQKENLSVTIGVITENEPYSWIENGQMMGFSIDVLEEVSSHTGLRFEYRPGNWSEIFPAFLRGEIDAIDEISFNPDRAELILFTEPYHFRKQVIMHNIARPLPPIDALKDLKPFRIGIVRDIYTVSTLKEKDLEIIEYDATPNLIRALAFGWVDAIIGPELTLQFLAEKAGFGHLEAINVAPLNGMEDEDFRIGVLKGNEELHRILSAGLNAIPSERFAQIEEVWKEYGGQTFIQSNGFRLTEQQSAYVRRLGALRVGFMREYAPFSFEDNGALQGLTVDKLSRIQDMTGLQIIPVTDRWSVLFDLFQRGEIDIITNISDKPSRHEFTRFTSPYFIIPNVVFTRDNAFQLDSLDDLNDKRIAIGSGIFYEDLMRERFGDNVIGFASLDSMFKALSEGSIDAIVTALPNGNHWVRELGLTDIRIAGEFILDNLKGEDLRFGIRPELEPLVDIIDQALQAISPTEKRIIENRWLGANFRSYQSNQIRPVPFSESELAFLTERDNRLRVCVHPSWMPIEGIDQQNHHTGMSSDFLSLFADRFDISFSLYRTRSWNQSLEAIKAGDCDLLPATVQTTERLTYLDFTTPYLSIPNIILGRVEAPFIDSPLQLGNVSVGIVEDYAYTELLKIRYPNLRFVIVNNEVDGLRRLQRGEIETYISTLTTASYHLQELGLADIKVIGRVHVDRPLSMATRNDHPELRSIAQKMVDSISDQDHHDIERKWRTVHLQERIDYSLIWKLALSGLFIMLMLFLWNRKLNALNQKLSEANQKLAELSILDGLTGVGNRKHFDQTYEQSFRWCQRHQVGFAVAMIDIDHFKVVNDTWGHKIGDDCLVALGECLKAHARRETDHIARIGGEEFVVYETYESEKDTVARFEKLRTEVEKIKINTDNEVISYTLSIGLATGIPNQVDSPEDFMKCADRALYEGKRNGRNRVVHDPIIHA